MPDDKPFDVFLSHSSPDKSSVEKLARRLEDEAKLKPWLDKWNLVPGEPWQEALEQALDGSRTCAVFIGPGDIRPWANEEMRSALQTRASHSAFRVIPVLLPGATLPERGELPRFLSRLTWVDFRSTDGVDDADAFSRLVAGIRGLAPGRVEATASTPVIECPYRGLEVEEAHAGFYFGREAMTQHLVEALRPTRFLAVLGASGSGKSSLVRAGLLPRLKGGALPESARWTYLVLKPGAHPLQELALSLARAAKAEAEDPLGASLQLLRSLESDERSLHLYVRGALSGQPGEMRFFILVDQFEESFTLCQNETERVQLIDNFRYAATVAEGQTLIVMTMRADFLSRAAEHTELAELLSGHQFVVSPMDETDLREAIKEPARLAGLSFEKGLVERILRDVGHEPGALPLLEHALLQVCENRRSDNVMTLQAYDESGGVQGALAKRADEIFEGFTPEGQQGIARRIMLRLTQPGEGTEDTRRRAAMSELWTRLDDQASAEEVVERLTIARLLTTSTDASGERQVDVAHEALIRGWPRLRKWIDEDRAALRVHRRLTEAAHEWKGKSGDASFLYGGARLVQAVEWRERNEAALNPVEREFLDASVALEDKERSAGQRRVWLSVGTLVTALVLISIFAFRSLKAERDASSRELAAISTSQLTVNPELSLLLALQAVRVAQTDQAEDALRRSLVLSHSLVTMRGHTSGLLSAAFSSDGNFVVTASSDHTARVWDAKTGQTIAELRGQSALTGPNDDLQSVARAAFSPDGKFVVTAAGDDTARVWDAKSGQTVAELRGHTGGVRSAAFSPDGKLVVIASFETARVWDAKTGQSVAELRGHKGGVWSAAFSPDGKFVVTASQDSTARVWDAKTGQTLAELRGHTRSLQGAVFSPDGRLVLTASLDSTARVWHAINGKSHTELRGHTGGLDSAEFSPDGKFVVTGSLDSTARVWDAKTGQTVAELRGHRGTVYGPVFSPDGRFVVTASLDSTARVWEAQTGRTVAELRGHTYAVYRAAFSPDGRLVVTASSDGTARVWDAKTRETVAELRGHTGGLNSGAFSPDGHLVVTASQDKTARLWDPKTGQTVAELRGHIHGVRSAAFSPDGKLVVTASLDNTARLWDAEAVRTVAELSGHTDAVNTAAFSPDGKFVVTASNDHTARVWDAKTGKTVAELRGHTSAVNSAAFSPNGRSVVTASVDRIVRVWDAKSGHTLAELRGHTQEVNSAAFSSDGKLVVSAGYDSRARVWDAKTGQPVAELRGHTYGVLTAAFSPDSKLVVTASLDNTARVWNTKTGQTIVELRARTGQFDSKGRVSSAAFSPDGKFVLTAIADGTAYVYGCEICASLEDLLAVARTRVTRELTSEERKTYLHE